MAELRVLMQALQDSLNRLIEFQNSHNADVLNFVDDAIIGFRDFLRSSLKTNLGFDPMVELFNNTALAQPLVDFLRMRHHNISVTSLLRFHSLSDVVHSVRSVYDTLTLSNYFDPSAFFAILPQYSTLLLTSFRGAVGQLATVILTLSMSIIDFFFSALLFWSTLYYLLVQRKFILDFVVSVLPSDFIDARNRIQHSFQRTVKDALLSSVRIFSFHFLFTWLITSLFDLPLIYIPALVSGFTGLIQFLPTWLALLPYCAYIYFSHSVTAAAAMAIGHILVWFVVDPSIYSEVHDSHHFIVGMSVMGGLYMFSLQGVVIGPLLVCSPVLLYRILAETLGERDKIVGDVTRS